MHRLSKSIAALDQHLKLQNREPFRSSREMAPTAPHSTDPTRCRWCRGTLRELLTPGVKDYCERGCAKAHETPTLAQCADCEREFETGLPLMAATLCFTCDLVERKKAEEAHRQVGKAYNAKTTGRGDYY
jgi:hypothetical protein